MLFEYKAGTMIAESLLKPLESLLNRQIESSTPAREYCEQLEGKHLAIQVRNTKLVIYILVTDGCLHLSSEYDEDPDAMIIGTLTGLASLAGDNPDRAFREGRVTLDGDAETANLFRRLLEAAGPDWEEELSRLTGDVAAHQIGNATRNIFDWGRRAIDTMAQNVSEFLQEESRDAPSRFEAEELMDEIDSLRNDVDRLVARIDKLTRDRDSCDLGA